MQMTQLADLLARISDSTDLGRLSAALTETPVTVAAPMPDAEQEIWLSGASAAGRAAIQQETFLGLGGQRADVAAMQVQTLRSLAEITMDAAGIAARLGKSESTVSRMTKRDELRPVQVGAKRLYPLWQVHQWHQDRWLSVPHVGEVCDAAEAVHLHPLSLDGFLRIRTDALGDQTPLQWLVEGGPVQPVVELIGALRR